MVIINVQDVSDNDPEFIQVSLARRCLRLLRYLPIQEFLFTVKTLSFSISLYSCFVCRKVSVWACLKTRQMVLSLELSRHLMLIRQTRYTTTSLVSWYVSYQIFSILVNFPHLVYICCVCNFCRGEWRKSLRNQWRNGRSYDHGKTGEWNLKHN